MVIRTQYSLGRAHGCQHSQFIAACFLQSPGIKVVLPGTPKDAKGLLKSAIRADVAVNPKEDDFAKICAEQTEGRGVDIAILATPSVKALQTALSTLRKGGVLLIFGAPEKGEKAELDFSYIFLNEINVITSYSTSELETNLALRLIANGVVSFSDLITHEFSLNEIEKAFEVAHDPTKSMKVVVVAR